MQIYSGLNEAFVEELASLRSFGKKVNSRGFSQMERLFMSLQINDPTNLSIEVPARKFNTDYAILEWLWYLQANSNVENIGQRAEIWNKIADEKNEVESNYGFYLKDQWAWIIKEILNDTDSRRATGVINQPFHKYKNKQDYPCTHYIHFFVREGLLHLGVYMRSNDAIFGFCNDVFTFCLFQQLMLNELNARGMKIKLGHYYHSAGSFHIYDRHYSMMNKICENYHQQAARSGYSSNLQKYELNGNLTFSKAASFGNFLKKKCSSNEISEGINYASEVMFSG